MKNPFRSASFILIVIFMCFAGAVILVDIISIIYYNSNIIPNSILIVLLLLIICGIVYIYVLNKKFKDDIIDSILTSKNLIIDFKYSQSEWLPFAKKYVKAQKKHYRNYIILITIFYAISSILTFLYADDKITSIVLINVASAIIFMSIIAKIKHFEDSILTDTTPEIKIAVNGILYNKKYLVSFNNQDRHLESSKQHSFYDENCIALTIVSPTVYNPQTNTRSRDVNDYYVLLPENVQNKDINYFLSLLQAFETY